MKKRNHYLYKYSLLFCAAFFLFVLNSCDFPDVNRQKVKPDPNPGPPADSTSTDTVGTVPQDGVLETVTWNLEMYKGQKIKTENDVKILDSLHADLYAFEEILGKDAIQTLASKTKGYKVVFDDTQNQDNAFLYNTNAITPLSFGKIDANDGQTSHEWAGRFPYFFSFNYKPGNGKPAIAVYAVVIHAKANFGSTADKRDSYNRRKNAAQDLYNYLTAKKPDARIIVLGDFNDDIDSSIFEGLTTSYAPFVNDTTNYTFVTKALTDAGKSTDANPRFTATIDHILISNEMVKYYIKGSADRIVPPESLIMNYESTTSDHYPVWARFNMRR